MKDKIEESVIEVLGAVWHGIDWDSYSQSMIKNIYPFFASRIRASANQAASYKRFVDLLVKRMKSNTSSVPTTIKDETEFLRRCRDETSYLIALFRQEIWKEQKERNNKNIVEKKQKDAFPF